MNKRWGASIGVISLVATTAYAVNDACDAFGELQGSITVAQAESSFSGAVAKDAFGRSTVVMDVNGDGESDLVVGAPGYDFNGGSSGAVFVFYGPITDGLNLTSAAADVSLYGEVFGEGAGYDVANAGDVDGDGIDDLLIGVLPTSASPNKGGVAYLVLGDSGLAGDVDLATEATARFLGNGVYGPEFGSVVQGVGDVNDDGFDDILVAAPLSAAGGVAYVFAGPAFGDLTAGVDSIASFTSAVTNSSFGVAAERVGDVTGDGIDDLAIGAPRNNAGGPNAGAVFVFEGGLTLAGAYTSGDAWASYQGQAYDRAGASIAAAGDLDADGINDLWIGSKQATSTKRGAVDLVLGDQPGAALIATISSTRFLGDNANDLAGSSIAANGDFNNDGVVDILIGGERGDGAVLQTGAAWVVHGPLLGLGTFNLTGADAKIVGDAYLDYVGAEVAVGGDLNGDGFDDAIVTAWQSSASGLTRAGEALVYLGGSDDADEVAWYADGDNDGFGDPAVSQLACEAPSGYVAANTDCGPSDNTRFPGAPESCSDVIDKNCDGFVGVGDNDGDGFSACDECDDGNVAVNPSADEVCGDSLDNDCDGGIDDENAVDAVGYYPDADGDGYGNSALGVVACEDPGIFLVTTVNEGGDCDDTDVAISPAAFEVCDFQDNDCDAQTDESEALDAVDWYADADADTYGSYTARVRACEVPSGYVANADDCDDSTNLILPGATEVCDFQDNDCDGMFYLGGPVATSSSRLSLTGEGKDQNLGAAISFLGDQDGDGDDELVVAAPSNGDNAQEAGAVYLVRGNAGGGSFALSQRKVDGSGHWDVKISGTRLGGFFGSVVTQGDVNGDGTADLIVGSYGARVPNYQQGAVYVFYGPIADGEMVAEGADFIVKGQALGDQAGLAVAAGDLDGDGSDDLVIGSPLYDVTTSANNGAAYVFYGGALSGEVRVDSADAWFYGTAASKTGAAVAVIDLDGDADLDLVIGAPEQAPVEAGAVHIVYGTGSRFSGLLASSGSITGMSGGDQIGYALGVAGDVNNDGSDDLLVGSSNNAAYLFWGGAAPATGPINSSVDVLFSGGTNQRLGEWVAGLGDINNDGFADIGLSGHRDGANGNNSGAAIVIYGASDFSAYENTSGIVAANNVESFGRLAPSTTFPTYSAANLGYMEGARLLGAAAGDQLGKPIVGGGDFNGDGVPDVAAGAPRADLDAVETDAGQVVMFLAGEYGTDRNDVVNPASQTVFTADADCDGYFDELNTQFTSCEMHVPTCLDLANPPASVLGGTPSAGAPATDDCDDSDDRVYPGANEVNNDGIDRDCDGFDNVNALPRVTITFNPAQPTATDDVEAVLVTSDADGEVVNTTIAWYVNGAEVVGQIGTVLPSTFFNRGDVVQVQVMATDGRDTVGPTTRSVSIGNSVPTIDSCDVTPLTVGIADDMLVTAAGTADADPADTVSVTYQWQQRFGPVWSSITGETATTLQSCTERNAPGYTYNCGVGSSLRAQCRPSDGSSFGETIASNVIVIRNTPPVVTSCSIVQASANTTDTLTSVSTATDVDAADTVTVSYEWLINGVSSGVTGSTLLSTFTEHFDVVQVRCTATDTNLGSSVPVTSSPLTISNLPPGAPVIDLLPNAPTSLQDLAVTIVTPATDTDGDAITYSYAWTVDNSPFSNPTYPSTNPNVGFTSTVRDQEWAVTVTSNDSYVNGGSDSDSVIIRNAAPTVGSAVISPSPTPLTADTITASGVGFDDNDGDPEAYQVQWYVNGVAQAAQPIPLQLGGANFRKGDTVYVTLRAVDPFTTGNLVTSPTVTIGNSAPTAPVLAITPNPPGETDTLTCNITTPSTDADTAESGDAISYAYAWYRNTVLVAGQTAATLPDTETAFGDVVYCTVTPNDGTVNGDVGTSATIAIQDLDAPPAPTVTAIDRYTNSSTASVGGTCTPGITQCNTIVVTCNDGFGPVTYNTTCGGGGTFAQTVSLTAGVDTTCSAICRDSSLNPSASSNSTIGQFCSIIDTREEGTGYGDSATNVINEFATLADTGASVAWQGNIIGSDVVDWYQVNTSDNIAADRIALRNLYNFQLDITAGGSDYSFQVFRNDPLGAAQCPSLTDGYDAYDFDVVDVGGFGHAAANNSCAPVGTPGVPGNYTLYNVCEDFTSTYYVRVLRNFNTNCQHYAITASNGL